MQGRERESSFSCFLLPPAKENSFSSSRFQLLLHFFLFDLFVILMTLVLFRDLTKTAFQVRPTIIYLQKISWVTWVEAAQKFDFFVQKSWSFCNSKHFPQNIMMLCCSCYFCISSIFNFFQIIMVSLFLVRHDQYFIMYKDSNVFEFTNFPFKTKA